MRVILISGNKMRSIEFRAEISRSSSSTGKHALHGRAAGKTTRLRCRPEVFNSRIWGAQPSRRRSIRTGCSSLFVLS